MCGRFSLFTAFEEIQERFRIEAAKARWRSSYNIAPSQDVLVVFEDEGSITADNFQWGFVPHWSDKLKMRPLINARAESLAELPSFAESFATRRCIIPADGFFEWKSKGGKKQPYYVNLKTEEVFGFAGLYSVWAHKEEELKTVTIITTAPNVVVQPIHDRMPV
ncbi:MAG: SOS response-associated peptidase, partial [Candidatus Altiarchaeota archaeon]